MAKAHFMKKFVAALVSRPQNRQPNPVWRSPLREPGNPVGCKDCHDPRAFNLERMKAGDPGALAVESFRRNRRFMTGLMKKWVKRLNAQHAGKLREVVDCDTCHAGDPRR